MKHTFRSLRHRNYRLFFTSQAVSFTGTWLQLIAQTLLVYDLTGSGTALGVLIGVQFAPTLLFGAWAGVVVDRHDKRRIMQFTSSAMLVAALALGVLVLSGHVTVGLVYVLAAVLGLANSLDNPARRSLVNDLVPKEELTNAVALNSTLATSARLVGPALAGVLVATVGIGWCFVLNGLSFLAPIIAVRMMDAGALRTTAPLAPEKGQLRAGLRYAWSVDDVRVPLLMVAVVSMLAFNSQVTFPLLAERELGGGDSAFAWLMTSASVGMILGSLWMARRRTVDTALLGRSAIVFGGGTALLAVAPNLPFALAAAFCYGLAAVGINSGANTVIQLAAEPTMRGRVLALYTVVFLGATPIGGPVIGAIAEHVGTRVAIGVGAVASVLTGVSALAFVRRRRGLAGHLRAPVASLVALGADGSSAAA